MHRLLKLGDKSKYWSPQLNGALVRCCAPFRRVLQRRQQKILDIRFEGLNNLRGALDGGNGVLITPNHNSFADPFLLSSAGDVVNKPFYYMSAWQVFANANWLSRKIMRWHGCFSVDREGRDIRSVRQAIDILQSRSEPLVIFPEGEMYHLGERILPFHEGALTIAMKSAARSSRPIVCLPTALRYYFLEDPTAKLEVLMGLLEQALLWRPREDLPLEKRLYKLAEGVLALKELEYLGCTYEGTISDRMTFLCDSVLTRLELRYGVTSAGSIPKRVVLLRQRALAKMKELSEADKERLQCLQDLDNMFFVIQLYSYPANYVEQHPSLERIAETLDRLEEDILGVPLASIKASRGAVVAFGKPLLIDPESVSGASELTRMLEQQVQQLLQSIDVPSILGKEDGNGAFEVNDFQSRLNATRVKAISYPGKTEIVQKIITKENKICVAGGRHAMGGQQFCSGTHLIDMRGVKSLKELNKETGIVTVGTGIQWPDLIAALADIQTGEKAPWSIRQKQTGVDDVTIGGTVAANAHGRGLAFPPFADDVESLILIDATGKEVFCSRQENSELFSLTLGGYGLTGVITQLKLRLVRRQRLERRVEVILVSELLEKVDTAIAQGFTYGDCQYSIDFSGEAKDHQGVFSCYRPVDASLKEPKDPRSLSEKDWAQLYFLSRTNKKKAFDTYSAYYLTTNGQLYWSDTHQMNGGIDYYTDILEMQRGIIANNSEMISEVYVPYAQFYQFFNKMREDFIEHNVDLTYGTIRFLQQDNDSFLATAKEKTTCILCNLNVAHTDAGRRKSQVDFQRLIDRAIEFKGCYFLTYHRWARKDQILAAFPQFVDFLKLKRKYDPDEKFSSDWYLHYKDLFKEELR